MWPTVTNATYIQKIHSHDKTYTTMSIVINEMISMYIEKLQTSENHCSVAKIQQMDAKKWATGLSCAFVVKKATYSGRTYKTEPFKSLHWINIIQLRIKWTKMI